MTLQRTLLKHIDALSRLCDELRAMLAHQHQHQKEHRLISMYARLTNERDLLRETQDLAQRLNEALQGLYRACYREGWEEGESLEAARRRARAVLFEQGIVVDAP